MLFWSPGTATRPTFLGRWQAKWARLRKKEPDTEHLVATVDRLFDAFHVLKTRGWKAPAAAAALGVLLTWAPCSGSSSRRGTR